MSVLQIFQDAVVALNKLFYIALQEEFDISVLGFVRELNLTFVPSIAKERDQGSNAGLGQQKADLMSNQAIMRRAADVNSYDIKLYQLGMHFFTDRSIPPKLLSFCNSCGAVLLNDQTVSGPVPASHVE